MASSRKLDKEAVEDRDVEGGAEKAAAEEAEELLETAAVAANIRVLCKVSDYPEQANIECMRQGKLFFADSLSSERILDNPRASWYRFVQNSGSMKVDEKGIQCNSGMGPPL